METDSKPVRDEREVTSEGQRLLIEVTDAHAVIAGVTGVDKSLVSRWKSGAKSPGSAARAALHGAYGIHPSAWNRLPNTPPPASGGNARPPKADSTDTAGRPTIDLVNERIDLYAEMVVDTDLDPEVRLRAGELERKCIAERRALEREARVREADIVANSPEWASIRRRTLDVLKSHPDAFRAWVEAMGDLAKEGPRVTEETDEDEEA